MPFAIDDMFPEELKVHEAARKLVTAATRRLFDGELGPLGSDAGNTALHGFFDWRETHPNATLGDPLQSILPDFEAEPGSGTLADAIEELRAKEADEDFDLHQSVYVLDETVIASALAQILFEGGVDDDARERLTFAVARQSHAYVLSRVFDGLRTHRRAALREAERLISKAGRPTGAATRAKRREQPAPPWREGDVVAHRLPQGRTLFLHLLEASKAGVCLYVLDWDAPSLPASDAELTAIQPKPSDEMWKLHLEVPAPARGESEEAWHARLHRVLAPTGRSFSVHRVALGTLVNWRDLDDFLVRHWRWPDVTPPPAWGATPPLPEAGVPTTKLQRGVIGWISLRVPQAHTTLAPPPEPEGRLKQVMEGGQREGGINVSPAGPGATELVRAYCWCLREAGFEVPSGHIEIALEHRSASAILRGVAPIKDPSPSWAGTLKLVKGVVQLTPAHKHLGPAIKIPVKQMSPVAS